MRARGAKGGSMTSREIDRVEIRKDEGQRRNSTISTNNESRENLARMDGIGWKGQEEKRNKCTTIRE